MWGNLVQRLGLQTFTAKGTKILQTTWQGELKKKNTYIKNWEKMANLLFRLTSCGKFCYYQCFYSINTLILSFVSLRPKSSLFVWTDQCQFLWILWCLIKRVHFAGFMTQTLSYRTFIIYNLLRTSELLLSKNLALFFWESSYFFSVRLEICFG